MSACRGVQQTSLSQDAESDAEERVTAAMEAVHRASLELRSDRCPNCGERLGEDAIESAGTDTSVSPERRDNECGYHLDG